MDHSSEILQFYGWWELTTCLFAFLALISIWFHLGRKKGDLGQVFLAVSILCWAFSGAFEIYAFHYNKHDSVWIIGWRSIFSLLNSLFILFSIPWFKHLPLWLHQAVKSRYWYLIVGLPFLFCLFPTVSRMITQNENILISELDVYYSILTLTILAFVLWQSFLKRGLYLLAYLSIVFILFTLVAQLYKFSDNETTLILFSAIFKTTLIMILFALALSWVKDLSQTLTIDSNLIKCQLSKRKNESGKIETILSIQGIPNTTQQSIVLTRSNYELMALFFSKKIKDIDQGWLEIKPKSTNRTKRTYDIKDYNEIKRLIHNILDGLYGKNQWSKERHELPFKSAFFEFSKTQGRKIRVKMSSDSLST